MQAGHRGFSTIPYMELLPVTTGFLPNPYLFSKVKNDKKKHFAKVKEVLVLKNVFWERIRMREKFIQSFKVKIHRSIGNVPKQNDGK